MNVERVDADGQLLGLFMRDVNTTPEATTFLTPDDANLQVGFVVKSASDSVLRHTHEPIERRTVGTAEVLIVERGSGEVDFFDSERHLVATRAFGAHDVLVLLSGGHGLRFFTDTVLLEVKQGPYPGHDEKSGF